MGNRFGILQTNDFLAPYVMSVMYHDDWQSKK
jgi:hypothetical protein